MQNPWLKLPERPDYVLESDRSAIIKHNFAEKPDYYVELQLLPEPFLGNPDAPVLLLNLNSGIGKGDFEQHKQSDFITLARQNLNQLRNLSYPFYWLNPALKHATGYQTWFTQLQSLIETCGQAKVAQGLLGVGIFPYHSLKYKAVRVASQEYSIYLVRQAIKRHAIIVQLRSKKLWLKDVPELASYPHYHELTSSQNIALTEANCPTGYTAIVNAISAR